MNLFAILRLVVYAKRISASLDSISLSLETIAQVMEDEWKSKHAPRPAIKGSIGTFDRVRASEEYDKVMAERDMLDQ